MCERDSVGTTYLLTFGFRGNNTNYNMSVHIGSLNDGNTDVSISDPTGQQVAVLDLPRRLTVARGEVRTLELLGEGIFNYNSLLVAASAPVTVLVMDNGGCSSFLPLPRDTFSTEFIAVSWQPTQAFSQLTIVTIDDTSIDIYLPKGTVPFRFNGGDYAAGDVLTVLEGQYSRFRLTNRGDLTGARVVTDQPVGVYSGNQETGVGSSSSETSHLATQLPPLSTWGYSVVVSPLADSFNGTMLKIVIANPNTIVTVTYTDFSFDEYIVTDEYLLIQLNQIAMIEASDRIMVTQFGISSVSFSDPSRPSMVVIPPISQYRSDYLFKTDDINNAINYVQLVVSTSDIQTLQIDGVDVTNVNWTAVPNTSPPMSVGNLRLQPGTHRIKHKNPLTRFGAILFSTNGVCGHAVSAGHCLTDLPGVSKFN